MFFLGITKTHQSNKTAHPVTVTTRIITFLVGNPYKPSFAIVTGWGVDPKYTYLFVDVPMKMSFFALRFWGREENLDQLGPVDRDNGLGCHQDSIPGTPKNQFFYTPVI